MSANAVTKDLYITLRHNSYAYMMYSMFKVLQCITAELLHTEVVSKCNNCNLLVNTQFTPVMKIDHVLLIWPC